MVEPAAPRRASTVIVLRETGSPFELLVVARHDRGFFGGLVVFPGGAVEEVDTSDLARRVVTGTGPDHAQRSAALRELAEETGFALEGKAARPSPDLRGRALMQALDAEGRRLAGDSITLVSRWVTPLAAPTRFDTNFYLAAVSRHPEVRLDRAELRSHRWVTPEAALERHRAGEWAMILPTLAHVRWLAGRESVEEAFAAAAGADGRTLVEPRTADDGSLVPVFLPADGN